MGCYVKNCLDLEADIKGSVSIKDLKRGDGKKQMINQSKTDHKAFHKTSGATSV